VKSTVVRKFRDIPIKGKLYFVVGIMALLIAIELFMLFFTINTLSSTRAYVGGEGLYSKAQKDAAYNLRKYGVTRNEEDYQMFLKFIQIPIGDRKARLELEKENSDYKIIYEAFIEGRNNYEDIDGMIKLFKRFRHIYYIDHAIAQWEKGDSLISELKKTGMYLHKQIYKDSIISRVVLDGTLNRIDILNEKLTVVEDEFSFVLGEGSRWLEGLIMQILFLIAITVEFTGLFLTVSVSFAISKGIDEISRVAAKVAKADFTDRAKVFSKDEIGRLAVSFNKMTDDLEQIINERNKAEESLRRQKNLYETLIKTQSEMGIGVAITENEKIIYVNEALCNIYGYKEDEILSMPTFMNMVVENDRDRLKQDLGKRIAGEKISDKGETSVVRKDGKIINIEYSLKIIELEEKIQIVSIIRDITEQKKAEISLKEKSEELTRSNVELEQFAYVASHDLREPLRTVNSYIQLLQNRYQGKLGTDGNDFIDFAVAGVSRMDRLIKDLLSYSRVGRKNQIYEKVDLSVVMGIVLDQLKDVIEKNNAKITYDKLPTIEGIKLNMIQLFQNLISNAVKFKREEPVEVKISVKEKSKEWIFSVSDNGLGIDKQYIDKIFVIFQRLHPIGTYEGTGIGLAICKRIVDQHKGTMWVESELGKGSVFYFTIGK